MILDTSETRPEPEYFSVASFISPDLLVLSPGRHQVRLLGIRPRPGTIQKAMEFLHRVTEAQRVFIRQDKVLRDENGIELAYLYLENSLFVNALLVKYDLVDVEDAIPFKYRDRFLKKQLDNKTASDLLKLEE